MSDKGLTPEEEVERADRTVLPSDWTDLSRFIQSYRFPYWETEHEGRYLELVSRGHIGDDSWALKDGDNCYNKRTRRFEYEVRQSSRTDEFLRDCRMTMDEARRIVPRVVWEANRHAHRRMVRIFRVSRWREQQNARKAAMQEVVSTFAAYLKERS